MYITKIVHNYVFCEFFICISLSSERIWSEFSFTINIPDSVMETEYFRLEYVVWKQRIFSDLI